MTSGVTAVDVGYAGRNHDYMSTSQDPQRRRTQPATASEDTGSDDPGSDDTGSDDPGSDDTGGDPASGRGAGAAGKVRTWCAARLPADWFSAPPDIQVDREEITIVGTLPDPAAAGDSAAERAAAAQGRIRRFREETRSRRIEIAREAEHRFRRKVSWGVTCGPVTEMFTTLSVPVMTRLRQSERRVLDTLVDAGVARSRSDALAWCVRLTGENADAWLARLRDALRHVEEVRDQGPGGA